MTDLETPSPKTPDPEAIATAQLVLPLVLTRLETDPVWSLAMIDALREQLDIGGGEKEPARPVEIGELLEMPAGQALAEAHAHAVKGELANATTLAQIALRDPGALGESKNNARLLLASLLERQGNLIEAAKTVSQACSDQPDYENARVDRDRIVEALRAKANAEGDASKAERIALLAAAMGAAGWNFGDAKAIMAAATGLLRGA